MPLSVPQGKAPDALRLLHQSYDERRGRNGYAWHFGLHRISRNDSVRKLNLDQNCARLVDSAPDSPSNHRNRSIWGSSQTRTHLQGSDDYSVAILPVTLRLLAYAFAALDRTVSMGGGYGAGRTIYQNTIPLIREALAIHSPAVSHWVARQAR